MSLSPKLRTFKKMLEDNNYNLALGTLNEVMAIKEEVRGDVPLITIACLIAQHLPKPHIITILTKMNRDSRKRAFAKDEEEEEEEANRQNEINPQDVMKFIANLMSSKEPEKQIKLIFLGDSQLCRLQRTLTFKKKFRDFSIHNLCVSGCLIQEGLNNLQRKVSRDPRLLNDAFLIVLLGTNDFLRNECFNKEAFEDILKISEKSLIITVPPILIKPHLSKKISIANKWICSLESPSRRIINLSALKRCSFEAKYHSGKVDLVHLNSNGFQILMDLILSELPPTKKNPGLKKKNQ